MKSELVPADGGEPIPIRRDVSVVGRRDFCDVRIDHDSLSKRHAVLVRTDGLLIVRDLASTNGTKVNGQRVMWAALLPNDRLTLGRCKFKVYLGPDHVASPSESYRGPRRAADSPTPVVPLNSIRALPAFPDPAQARNIPGSTDPDADVVKLGEFVLEDDDEEIFALDLE